LTPKIAENLVKEEVFASLPDEDSAPVKKSHLGFHEAVRLIEGRELDDRMYEAKHSLEERLVASEDREEQATCYFYLLRIILSEHNLIESVRAQQMYRKMLVAFCEVEKMYQKNLKTSRKPARKIVEAQLAAFYKLVDRNLHILEIIYQKKGFIEGYERAYEDKMRFRRRTARFTGNYPLWIALLFMDHASRYGHSFLRWGVTVVIFASFFAFDYWLINHLEGYTAFKNLSAESTFFDYFYFSMVSLTTLGYGDIAPISELARLVAVFQAVSGYIMLGLFLTLIQKKL